MYSSPIMFYWTEYMHDMFLVLTRIFYFRLLCSVCWGETCWNVSFTWCLLVLVSISCCFIYCTYFLGSLVLFFNFEKLFMWQLEACNINASWWRIGDALLFEVCRGFNSWPGYCQSSYMNLIICLVQYLLMVLSVINL